MGGKGSSTSREKNPSSGIIPGKGIETYIKAHKIETMITLFDSRVCTNIHTHTHTQLHLHILGATVSI